MRQQGGVGDPLRGEGAPKGRRDDRAGESAAGFEGDQVVGVVIEDAENLDFAAAE
jgi:hypothetical protein